MSLLRYIPAPEGLPRGGGRSREQDYKRAIGKNLKNNPRKGKKKKRGKKPFNPREEKIKNNANAPKDEAKRVQETLEEKGNKENKIPRGWKR